MQYSVYTGSEGAFAPNSVIVSGPTEMVLIDAQFLISDAKKLVSQLRDTKRKLTKVLITHAHPDHVWGLGTVLDAFPGVKAYAREGVIKEIHRDFLAKRIRWQTQYPGDIPATLPKIEPLDGSITVDGEPIEWHDLPPAETECATAFYVPKMDLAITGDLIFNKVHMYLADLNDPRSWIAAIKSMEDRFGRPATVVPGHGFTGNASLYDDNREYLSYYDQVAQPFVQRAAIVDAMVKRFPQHAQPIILALEIGPAITDPEMIRRFFPAPAA